MKTNRIHRIAVIPGDGIGPEVAGEGLKVPKNTGWPIVPL